MGYLDYETDCFRNTYNNSSSLSMLGRRSHHTTEGGQGDCCEDQLQFKVAEPFEDHARDHLSKDQ
jgi:hypothetical protein